MVSNAANMPLVPDDSDDSGMPELEAPAAASGAAAGSPTSTIGGHERMLMGILQGMQQNQMLLTQLASKGDRDDTKRFSSKDLTKMLKQPERFAAKSREEEHAQRPNWSWGLEQYLSCLDPGFIPDLQALSGQDNPVFMKDMTEDTRERSRVLYGVLAGLLHDKGKRFLRTNLDHNGYEAYRQISKDLQPKTRSRLLALLRTINQRPSFDPKLGLASQLVKLEAAFEEYSVLQGHALEENLRISALLSCLSGQLRQYANVMISETSTYSDLRSLVVRWDAAQTKWAPSVAAQFGLQEGKNGYVDDGGGLAPMDIDRIKGKGKEKGKGKGKGWNDWSQGYKGGKGKDQGKGKGKGKDWNDWSQGYKGGKGKDKGKGKSKGGQKGPCHTCGRMGHLARDCWGQSVQHVSSSDTASTTSGPSVAPSSGVSSSASSAGSSVSAAKPRVNRVGANMPMIVELDDSDREVDLTIFALESDSEQHVNVVIPVFDMSADDGNDEWTVFQGDSFNLLDPDDWSLEGPRVLAVSSGRGRSTEIVMDSRADASVLPLSFLGVGESVQLESTGFSDAQGHALKAFDWRLCTVELGNVRIRERFLVSNVTCPLLASGKLHKAGWGMVNNGDGPVFVHGDDKRIPCYKQSWSTKQQFNGTGKQSWGTKPQFNGTGKQSWGTKPQFNGTGKQSDGTNKWHNYRQYKQSADHSSR